ncbi:RNA polymerase sigma factor [Pseudonocardia spinosispora]|uniref:RNA polymerase sigma factor n=1 Tax=Pseudonocardia spinosispora TaxID=103441 RepID=UPI0003FCC665|nr:sigma-70 family RNA polymerase sigma factor [Pseudonocardia spinosispora]
MADVADVSASSDRSGRGSRDDALVGRAFEPPDDQVVARVSLGDESALGVLYDRYGRSAYSLARQIRPDDSVAETVVREAFLSVWRDPQRFDPKRGPFNSWFTSLVHRIAVDTPGVPGRGRKAMSLFDGPAERGMAGGASAIAEQVHSALRRLPAEQRQTLALAYYGAHTQREIAAITGVPVRTVQSRIFAAVQRLRRLLVPHRWDTADVVPAER